MTVQDLLINLGRSELYNSAWCDDLTGLVKEERIPTIISYINEGLLDLHDKFPLKIDTVYLDLVPGKTTYEISSEHQMDSDMKPTWNKYLWKGHNKKYEDNLLKIIEIYTTSGRELSINNDLDPLSIVTPTYNTIKIPNYKKSWELCITYLAKHAVIKDINDKIVLPPTLEPALQTYVAYKVYNAINSAEAVQTSSRYATVYNNFIKEALESDNVNSAYRVNNSKFFIRGWV